MQGASHGRNRGIVEDGHGRNRHERAS
jgi:hypothetical protein